MAPCRRHHQRSSSLSAYTLAALLALSYLADRFVADASTCAFAPKTLSTQCNNVCDTYHPCVIVADALDTDNDCNAPASGVSNCYLLVSAQDPCNYECFSIDKQNGNSFSTFSFYVPFGTWRSKQDRESSANDPAWAAQVSALTAVKLNDSVAWKNNDKLQKIAYLELPDTCSSMYVVAVCG